ncbi:restriction endonuclease [Salinicola sp. CR57]|uniref:restriction endonuclease n=1 Tax=Salinicola sp. CR57 TaxID=1949086 RepID=UPI000DA21530|nr:restriction endonuclease [Salinicola sp. CR57]
MDSYPDLERDWESEVLNRAGNVYSAAGVNKLLVATCHYNESASLTKDISNEYLALSKVSSTCFYYTDSEMQAKGARIDGVDQFCTQLTGSFETKSDITLEKLNQIAEACVAKAILFEKNLNHYLTEEGRGILNKANKARASSNQKNKEDRKLEVLAYLKVIFVLVSAVEDIKRLHEAHMPFIPHWRPLLSTRKIKFATGEYDRRKIAQIYKKELGYETDFKDGFYEKKPTSFELLTLWLEKHLVEKSSMAGMSKQIKNDGSQLEQNILSLYKKLGYAVSETPTSGDFGIDIIAESSAIKIGIQCKDYQKEVGVDAIMQAHSGAKYYDCDHAIVIAKNGFTKAAQEMGTKLNIELLIPE